MYSLQFIYFLMKCPKGCELSWLQSYRQLGLHLFEKQKIDEFKELNTFKLKMTVKSFTFVGINFMISRKFVILKVSIYVCIWFKHTFFDIQICS